ncbi:class I SAM-dependent methyltransferase [Salegentibacter sp. LM13S]|uniref:class I SAM-dependent methyltransferase n=1 Tax=Salegentibacter lacus TaxID=2873599 RepID=UPI001CCF5425|nr:class I SAM-dependent methyltransferase [Salegentibacter lacus]MBZ9630389.1 class I SAM-dependent methyltransferase [Salegentibacter lacus]
MICPLCQNLLNNEKDSEYYECDTCKALVKRKELWPDSIYEKSRYLEHNNDVTDERYQKFTSPITNYILKNFSPLDIGLDFGSGTGPVISSMLEQHNYIVKKYDPYFANYPDLLEEKYEYIFACEVVEHFYNPRAEFLKLKSLLKPEGALILMTLLYNDDLDFKNWRYRMDPTHVFIYQKETFQFIKENIGFSKLDIDERLIVLE